MTEWLTDCFEQKPHIVTLVVYEQSMESNHNSWPIFKFTKVQKGDFFLHKTETHTKVHLGLYAHWTHHGKQKAEHQKEIVVSRECHRHPKSKLTEAGEHQNLHTANSGATKQTWRGGEGVQRQRKMGICRKRRKWGKSCMLRWVNHKQGLVQLTKL